MTCGNCGLFRPTAHYKLALRRVEADLCSECHAALFAIGMVWVLDQRTANITPIVERRQPAWLANLRGRDESGRLSA